MSDPVRKAAAAVIYEWQSGNVDAELDYAIQELKRAFSEPAPAGGLPKLDALDHDIITEIALMLAQYAYEDAQAEDGCTRHHHYAEKIYRAALAEQPAPIGEPEPSELQRRNDEQASTIRSLRDQINQMAQFGVQSAPEKSK